MKQFFRTFIHLAAAIAVVATISSCTKETMDSSALFRNPGVKRTINSSAAFPQTSDKAYLDNLAVKWDNNDRININGTTLAAAGVYDNGKRATFYGTVNANEGTYDEYWAVYPATLAGNYANNSIPSEFGFGNTPTFTYTLPTIQYDTVNSNRNSLQNRTYMAGYTSVARGSSSVSFKMCNLGAVMIITLQAASGVSNLKVSQLVFSSTTYDLSGKFTFGADSTITVQNGVKCLTVVLSDGTNPYIDITTAKNVYVFLPPMASGHDLTMKIYSTDGSYTTRSIGDMPLIERNKLYTNTVDDISTFNVSECFSVSSNTRVYFSPGNLQWSATGGGSTPTTHVTADGTADGTWRFAEHQWDTIGAGNANISSSCTGWIDLFGWGTSGYNNNNPYITGEALSYYSNPNNDIALTKYDWGVYNAILNPNKNTIYNPGTWRTLTKDEWVYLINNRSTTSGIHYAKAEVNGIKGLIIVPDGWNASVYALTNTDISSAASSFEDNVLTIEQWIVLENAGCTFLPITGYRSNTNYNSGNFGDYWSSTFCDNNNETRDAYILYFRGIEVTPNHPTRRWSGRAVRLVRNAN